MNLRNLELINLDIDGRLGQSECDELEALLAADPIARTRHTELRALGSMLASVPDPKLPADFRENVMQQVQLRDRRAARLLAGRPRRLAFALAASVVVAVLAFKVLDHDLKGTLEGLAGTLARPAPTDRGEPPGVSSQDVASFAVQPVAGGVVLAFDLPSGTLGDLVIDLSAAKSGAKSIVVPPDQGITARVEPGRIVLPHVAGGTFKLRLAGSVTPGELAVVLVRDGVSHPVAQRQLSGR